MTLNELMMVVIIVSVTAGLAIPLYVGTVEKVRGDEARGVLLLLRAAEKVYYVDADTFIDLDGVTRGPLVDAGYIQDPNAATLPFGYVVTVGGGGTTFVATATRNSGCNSGEEITINENGVQGGDWTAPCG